MKIVVYYDNLNEQELAERIVPDVKAIAKFAADAMGNRFAANPIDISAHSEPSSRGGYTIADLQALMTAPNPAITGNPVFTGGAQGGGGGPYGAGGVVAGGQPGNMVYVGDLLRNVKLYGETLELAQEEGLE